MIGSKHFRKIARWPVGDKAVAHFEEEKQLSRFLKYLDGTLTEITANDLAGVPYDPDDKNPRGVYECLANLKRLRRIELPEHYTIFGAGSFALCGNAYGESVEVIFPSSLISMDYATFTLFYGTQTILNFTKVKQIPIITNNNNAEQNTLLSAAEVIVPLALYDSWVKDAMWSRIAERIRGV